MTTKHPERPAENFEGNGRAPEAHASSLHESLQRAGIRGEIDTPAQREKAGRAIDSASNGVIIEAKHSLRLPPDVLKEQMQTKVAELKLVMEKIRKNATAQQWLLFLTLGTPMGMPASTGVSYLKEGQDFDLFKHNLHALVRLARDNGISLGMDDAKIDALVRSPTPTFWTNLAVLCVPVIGEMGRWMNRRGVKKDLQGVETEVVTPLLRSLDTILQRADQASR